MSETVPQKRPTESGLPREKGGGRSCGVLPAPRKFFFVTNSAQALCCYWQPFLRQVRADGYAVTCCLPDADGEPGKNADIAEDSPHVEMTDGGTKKNEDIAENVPRAETVAAEGDVLRYPLDRKGFSPFRDLQTLRALVRLFRRERPEIVFAATIKSVIYAGIAARIAGIPHFFAAVTGLGFAFEADTPAKRLLRHLAGRLYRFALRRADSIFFLNRDDREEFLRRKILDAAQPTVLCKGTGIDVEHFAPAPPVPEPLTFLFVGRLLRAKGLHEFAAAARKLRAVYPGVRFQVLGPPETGPGALSPRTLAEWQSEGVLEYLGSCPDVRPFVRAASVMVLPSWREGLPTAVLEGMAMGRPAVVTDVPGCRDAVRDGRDGFLVPARESGALASALEKFILNPALAGQMGLSARRRVCGEFSASRVVGTFMKEVERCCGRAPG